MNELTTAVCQVKDASQANGHEAGGHDLSDAELLRRFLAAGDQPAFEALVRRHGPMVHGVCRRVLPDMHAAEDAFQATFLVFVRKAGSLRQPELLSNWLYGTAYRIARKARLRRFERQTRESRVQAMPSHNSLVDLEWQELRTVLDEELNRLPEQLRAPLVLCYLCGQTNVEAARNLGWPTGSIAGRLSQAREALRNRLNRRGLSLSAGLLALLLSEKGVEAAAPEELMALTVAAAGSPGSLPASVAGLVEVGIFGEPASAILPYARLASAAAVAVLALLMGWSAVRAAGHGRDLSALSGRGGWSFSALLGGNSSAGAAVSAPAAGCAAGGCGAATGAASQSIGCAPAGGGCAGGAADSSAATP